jgi:hypothetical protein
MKLRHFGLFLMATLRCAGQASAQQYLRIGIDGTISSYCPMGVLTTAVQNRHGLLGKVINVASDALETGFCQDYHGTRVRRATSKNWCVEIV